MRKTILALAAIGLVGATLVATTDDANAQRRRGRWIAPAIVGGALLGGALAAPYYYGSGPGYVYDDEPTCVARERVWVEGRGWRWRRVAVPC